MDNTAMGFRFRRSVKILPGIRLNFGKRGVSTSIGVRGAHVTFGATGTRTTVGLPGSGLSYTHLDKPHRETPTLAATEEIRPGSAARGGLWIVLIVVAVVAAIGHLTGSSPPPPTSMPPRTEPPTTAQAVNDPQVAAVNTAARGAAQIRNTIPNSNTLRFARVTAMPGGAICYRFNLRNSRGVSYSRSAVMEGAVITVSGSREFDALWNRRCSHDSDAPDIRSALPPAAQDAPITIQPTLTHAAHHAKVRAAAIVNSAIEGKDDYAVTSYRD
jgi:hypothetical protein